MKSYKHGRFRPLKALADRLYTLQPAECSADYMQESCAREVADAARRLILLCM